MASWRDYAQTIEPDGPTCANSVVSAERTPRGGDAAPIGPADTTGTGSLSLPVAVALGLKALPRMACPGHVAPSRWPAVVADALKLASDGWAAKGLALGWSPLNLFGAVIDATGDPYSDGLAVRLAGRPIVAMCANFATVDLGNGGRTFLHRATNDGARLLWDLTNRSKGEGQ